MQINENGITTSSVDDFLENFEILLKEKYGNDFKIAPEGVIDNIATSTGLIEDNIQKQIIILAKQFDPETAEEEWQDALYERIGVTRLEAQKSTFVLKVQGAANLVCSAGSMTIRSQTDNNEFIRQRVSYSFPQLQSSECQSYSQRLYGKFIEICGQHCFFKDYRQKSR